MQPHSTREARQEGKVEHASALREVRTEGGARPRGAMEVRGRAVVTWRGNVAIVAVTLRLADQVDLRVLLPDGVEESRRGRLCDQVVEGANRKVHVAAARLEQGGCHLPIEAGA